MNTRNNLPPGCTSDDGISEEDRKWEQFAEWVGEYAGWLNLTPEEAKKVWIAGVAARYSNE